jgi:peptidoglycan/LPS O-acetylase OafA/YrhL
VNRIDRLTSIRGFAALYIVLFHCRSTIYAFDLPHLNGFAVKGYLAVDFFFVLSGFILAYVYSADFDVGAFPQSRFLALRLGRIYPVHLLTLALAAPCVLAPGFDNSWLTNTPASLLSNLLLVQAWGFHQHLSWNFVSWSISTEWFAYLLFPLFLIASRPFARRPLTACFIALITLIALGVTVAALLPPGISLGPAHFIIQAPATAPFSFAADFGILRIAFEFFAGVLLFRAYNQLRQKQRAWSGWTALTISIVLFIVLRTEWTRAYTVQDALAVICMAAAILCVALDSRIVGPLLELRPLVFLGEASFSIYMIHGVVFLSYLAVRDSHWLAPFATSAGAAVVAATLVAISVTAGIAMYLFVETPARRAARRWTDHWLQASPIAAG